MKENVGKSFFSRMSIRTRLMITFCLTAVLMFVVNVFLYSEINHSMRELDEVYSANVSLNSLSSCLEETQADVYEYLNTKSSDSLEGFYRNEQNLDDMLDNLNDKNVDSSTKMQEKNIRNMTLTYLKAAEETVQAKRGRNVEKYKEGYDSCSRCYRYIQTAIYNLNNMQFRINTNQYQILMGSMQYLELLSSIIIAAAAIINILLLSLTVSSIIGPLRDLAGAANEVADGNFEIQVPDPARMDEVGIVTTAFSSMVASIRNYVKQQRESMEKERKLKERELLMETHLKDAQLKYLQAQINPHFLFNSLNAGAQLAMLEDAEQTSIFIERMADFFRYNVRKMEEESTLAEEIEAVDNYVYILNVRFAGDVHFVKEVEPGLGEICLPSMILQPLVENAVNHGIRKVEWEGYIWLKVETEQNYVSISVRDNGLGITEERIQEIRSSFSKEGKLDTDSTGIGLDNVVHRLELYFDRSDLVEIHSDGPGMGAEVKLRIPLDIGGM